MEPACRPERGSQYGDNRVDVSDLTLVRGAQQIAITGGFDLGTDRSRPVLENRWT